MTSNAGVSAITLPLIGAGLCGNCPALWPMPATSAVPIDGYAEVLADLFNEWNVR
jgi:hypothetical protein